MKNIKTRQFLAVIVALVMVLTIAPVNGFAVGDYSISTEQDGESTYDLPIDDNDCKLTGDLPIDDNYCEFVDDLYVDDNDYQPANDLPGDDHDYKPADNSEKDDDYEVTNDLPDEYYDYEEYYEYEEYYDLLKEIDPLVGIMPFLLVHAATEQQLRDAVTMVSPGDSITIELTENISITDTDSINILADTEVSIQGNFTITNATTSLANSGMFNLGAGSHLIIDGPGLYGNFPPVDPSTFSRSIGIDMDAVNTAFTIKSGSVENFTTDGIRVTPNSHGAVVNVYGGYIGGNGHTGIRVDGGNPPAAPMSEIYVYGGTIHNNVMYGIWLYRNTNLEMHGGTIEKNATGVRMGGAGSTTFTMYDGYILNNIRTTYGGAGVWVDNNSIFTMNGGYIKYNQAPTGGGVRLGGVSGSTGNMVMNGGLIAYNTATTDGGGIFAYGGLYGGGLIPEIRPSALLMTGGTITQNTAGNNGGGVHLQNRQQGSGFFSVTAWARFSFQGGVISNNTAGNDGGGIWVNWSNRIFPPTGTAFTDLALGPAIDDENIFGNISRQVYGITDFDRNRLASHHFPTPARWFADHQIPLWNNDQINYAGIPLNYWIAYGVREGQGMLAGMVSSAVINGLLAPSPAAISGNEEINLTATPAPLYYVRGWSIGVSVDGQNPAFFTQNQIDDMITNGVISFVDNNGVISLIITNTGNLLTGNNHHIHVYVNFVRPVPSLTVTKTSAEAYAIVGHDITYTVTVTNTGEVDLTNVLVTDALPANTTLVDASHGVLSGNVLTHTIALLPVGGYVEIIITVTFDSIYDGQTEVVNTVVVSHPDIGGPVTDEDKLPLPKDNEPDTNQPTPPSTGIISPPRQAPIYPEDIPPELVPVDPMPISPTHFAYLIGYAEDGTIRPQSNITRAEVTTIFFRLITDEHRTSIWSQTNSFADEQLTTSPGWFNNAISTMEHGGLFESIPFGSYFNPNQAATRAEFAAMVVGYLGLGHYRVDNGNAFTDIEGHWASDAINVAYLQGWVQGFGDGTFRPNQPIARAEVAALINRALGRLPECTSDLLEGMVKWPDNMNEDAWYFLYIQEATNSHYHKIKDCGIYETWTRLIEPRNWSVLERLNSRPYYVF